MLDGFFYLIGIIANVEGVTGFVLRLIGLKALARLIQRRRVMIKGFGFRFFANRAALLDEAPSLGNRLSSAESADAIFALGQIFYSRGENTRKIKRLILPNPKSKSWVYYCKSMHLENTEKIMADTIEKAKACDAKVRLCPEYIGHSMVLVDTNKPTGWAHIEIMMPHSRPDERPSITIEKKRAPLVVDELQRTFTALWDSLTDHND